MIDKLHHYSLNNPASVYDEEALTALELAGRTASKVNEVVGDQNNLRTETEKHLDEQDTKIEDHREYLEQAVRRQDQTITTDINNIKTNIVPKTVTSEVQKRIDNGEFYNQIDESLGNLKDRVDNLLSNIPEGGTTADAELIDIRVDGEGVRFPNASESVKHQSEYTYIPLTFSQNLNYTVTESGWSPQPNTNFHMSNAVKVDKSWGKIYLYCNVVNQYRSRVVFTSSSERSNDNILYLFEDTSANQFVEITIPSNAEWMFVANDVDLSGNPVGVGHPAVYYKNYDTINRVSTSAQKGSEFVDLTNGGLEEVELNWIGNNRFINDAGYLKEGVGFKLSQPVPVPDGCILVFDTFTANPYVGKITFSKTGFASAIDTLVGDSHPTPTPGRYVIMTPPGYNYVYISSDTDIDGKTLTTPRLYRVVNLGESILNYAGNKETKTVTINLPDRYNLVVGKLFELFYKGLIKGVHPLNYDIKITSDVGKVYKRKFTYTPVSADVGEKNLTFTVRDDNGVVLASKTVTLCVNAKPSNPTTEKTVLCIGDSLTAGGEWISKCSQQLNNAGCNNIRFIGAKTSGGCNHEATPGYGIESYYEQSDTNPFYPTGSDSWSLRRYLQTIGESKVDIVCIFLGWNNRFMPVNSYKTCLNEILLNISDEFPDVKFLLFGLQFPDKDGLGESYGASWDFLDTVQYVIDHETTLNAVSDTTRFSSRVVNISGQFDTEYNMPTGTMNANNRNNTTETYINNGVHPSANGYNQISDIAFCEFVALLKEV